MHGGAKVKKFLVFLLFVSLFLAVLPRITHAEPQSRPVANGSKVWIEVGEIISADIFVSDPSCGNRGEKLHDDNENTYSVIAINQRGYFEFPYGGGTIWKNCTVSEVENDVRRYHPSWTRDQTCLVWPRGSSGGSCPQQPAGETEWTSNQWGSLNPGQWILVNSGIVYYNYTSQSQNTNRIYVERPTLISTTTRSIWIWTTLAGAKLYQNDPNLGYEKVLLSPPTNTDPQDGWIYGYIPAHGFSTGWVWAEINGSFVEMRQSCLNGLVVENNSASPIRIRYKQADPSNPKDRNLVTIYPAGNSLEAIKTHYANVLGVPVNHLSFRQIFLSPNAIKNPNTLLPN